ncbi:sensor domain-containing diguanylate cyclase [Frankia sp. QA3]|uniref:diguanylate cyclase domain-containing protein n=1 Tax=Frankia sp. QA3 TaxID=710111 RepID=UPI000269C26E|nr:sensor domain-containing diguanylate cyclase [Frankia sp. QA3]EIV91694.1 diguanylate cyclase (GGDEF) domain-containing protein [Frankia sp. QA3]
MRASRHGANHPWDGGGVSGAIAITEHDSGLGAAFASGGEMGRLMAAKDWGSTSLGPPETWSTSLRTCVGLCLESRFSMVITWGSELAYLYNDATIPILGRKHPGALGRPFREVWPEIWDFMRPLLDQVMSGGGATWSQDQRLLMLRHGYLEETYFTFSFGPVRDAERGGQVVGALTTAQETTRQMIDTRRLGCLRDLAAIASHRGDQRSVCARAAAVAGRWPDDLPYCLILLRDQRRPRSPPRLMGWSGLADERAAADLFAALAPGGPVPEATRVLTAGHVQVVDRLASRCRVVPADASPPSSAALAVPFANGRDGQPIGLLLAGVSDRLALDGPYRDFVALVAGQISTAVVSARGYEAARAREARARRRALRDGLTGLPNRVSFLDRLGLALARAEAGGWQDRVGLLFVDLDGFKAVNDSAGHQAGDWVLRDVAARLRRAVRPGDTVARLAGDEFAVLCAGITSLEAVVGIADRIVETTAVCSPGGGPQVTSSVGVAVSGPGLTDPREILHAADIAMYAAKRQGRHRRVLFDESLRTQATRRQKYRPGPFARPGAAPAQPGPVGAA